MFFDDTMFLIYFNQNLSRQTDSVGEIKGEEKRDIESNRQTGESESVRKTERKR